MAKAHKLSTLKPDNSVKQYLTAHGIKPGFVSSTLPKMLFDLARLRGDTYSAHGGVEIQTATEADAQHARYLVGGILRGLKSGHSKGVT